MTDRTYNLNCEVRAVEEGHRAFVQPGGSIKVKSDSNPDVSYEVTFHATSSEAIHFHCTCPSGKHRSHLLVPCKHATLAGRRLEREKIALWAGGDWWVHPQLKAKEDERKRPVAPPNISALCD